MKTTKIFSKATFIARAKQKAKENDWHLVDAGKELAKEVAFAYALYYGLILFAILAALATLSFTNALGGPFVVAQVIFFLVAGSVILAGLSAWWLWRKVKQQLKQLNSLTHKGDSKHNVYESNVVDGRLSDDQ